MKSQIETKQSIKELAENPNVTTELFQKIVSALRGPDSVDGKDDEHSTSILKWLTTARIRAIVAPGYFGDVTKEPLTLMERKMRDSMLEHAPRHFFEHYHSAVKAIKQVFKYDLIKEEIINDRPETSSSVDNSDGSRRGIKFGEISSWVGDLQQSQIEETIVVKSMHESNAVQLLERPEVLHQETGINDPDYPDRVY